MRKLKEKISNLSIDWRTVVIFLSVIGPGIITANVDNDAGGITTYSLAGANFGYMLLWSLIPITLVLILVQEMVARMGVVTGKGLADLIREKYGIKITFYVMMALILANFGNVVAEFAGVAAAGEIFGISRYILVPVVAFGVWLLVVKGTYKFVEKIFLWACLFYITYIISGFMAKPDWAVVAHSTFIPTMPSGEMFVPYIMMIIGIIGTTIAPWMQFYLQSSVVEKGIKIEEYKYTMWDVIMGSIITDVVAFFIILTSAIIFFKFGAGYVQTADQAAIALQPLAGNYATYLFAFGLLNASIFAASILPLSTSYSVCEGLGFESGINKKFGEAPVFYTIYTLLIIVGAGIILIPGTNLITIMFISQVLNGMLLPVILIFMLLLINDKKLMGKHVNSDWYNWVAWSSVIIISGLTLILVASYIWPSLF